MSVAKSGFIIHTYHGLSKGKPVVYAMGKLENGDTFGLVEQRLRLCFYIRASNLEDAEGALDRSGISHDPCIMTTMDGEPVLKVHGIDSRVLRNTANELESRGIETFEADIPLSRRYRIDHQITGPVHIAGKWRKGDRADWVVVNPTLSPGDREPTLAILALAIKTDPANSIITAVSLVTSGGEEIEEVHRVGKPTGDDPVILHRYSTEAEMLRAFADRIRAIDPDIITGWNVIDFDIKVIEERFKAHNIPFRIGRSRDSCRFIKSTHRGGSRATIPGRQVLDALHLVRHSLNRFDDMRLETVAKAILGHGNDGGEDGLEDARLVRDILEAENLIPLTLRRSILTGLPLDRAWGSVAAFDFLYISELHRRNIVAPTARKDSPSGESVPGGWVLSPDAGLHRNIAVFDFMSLYPSIIRTFNIDPLAHIRANRMEADETIEAPNGARFDREPGILPQMLDVFFQRRREAKAANDDLASYTYKIVMNSFYGVLGTRSCRFASPRLAGAITRFGHYLLQWARDLIEAQGFTVLYGDTDSLFVDLKMSDDHVEGGAIELCERVNNTLREHLRETFDVESQLELEYEKLFSQFLLPPLRGQSIKGRAKGYAGLRKTVDGDVIDIIGMEAVRRDWTDMAHELQRQFIDRLFRDCGGKELEDFVYHWISELKAGTMDDQLVYRRALRKPIASYTKTTPPHVKAAQLLNKASGVIYYVMTVHGPQPLGKITSPLDYSHYISKQIDPIVRALGTFCDLDVHAALTGEQRLL